jgi:rhamnosyltransferase
MVDAELSCARIIIPVRNGGERWREAAASLREAVRDPALVVVVDSSSSDGSDTVALDHGFEVHRIDVRTFNHGRTRQQAVERFCAGTPFVVFATQDTIVEGRESLLALLNSFTDETVGAAYGRQLPHRNALPFEAHAALFNYKPSSETRTLADAGHLGVKVAFFSNSYAAYRIDALLKCGGFPHHLIVGEDAYVAMRMLISGWCIRYNAEAPVRHSHAYSIFQEMQRYFDFGVMHAQMPEFMERFGQPEGEGLRFVMSELRYIRKVAPLSVPEVFPRNAAKYLGYRLGRMFDRLPVRWRRGLSMTRGYWDSPPVGGLEIHSG